MNEIIFNPQCLLFERLGLYDRIRSFQIQEWWKQYQFFRSPSQIWTPKEIEEIESGRMIYMEKLVENHFEEFSKDLQKIFEKKEI